MSPLVGAVLKRAALWWITSRPFSKEKREARKERRRRRREGLPPLEEIEMNKVLQFFAGLRTSTKSGIAGIVVPALALLPFYGQVNAFLVGICTDGNAPLAALLAGGVTWVSMFVSARLSKTPANPGVL